MKSLLRVALLAFVFSAIPSVLHAGSDKGPGAFAADFINSYLTEPCRDKGYKAVIAWMKKCPDVTDGFRQRLAKLYLDALKKEPELGYDADAIVGGQDSADHYRVKSCKIHGDRARVMLAGDGSQSNMQIKVDLVRTNNRWLVDGSGDLADGKK